MRMLCILLSASLLAADRGGQAEYVGGTLETFTAGEQGALFTSHASRFHFATRKKTVAIEYERINLLEYGQKVDRRYILAVVLSPLLLLSKSRRHFLTIGFTDEEGRQQALVFRVGKGDVRTVLAGLEARTGVKVTYQDEEARKAGKG